MATSPNNPWRFRRHCYGLGEQSGPDLNAYNIVTDLGPNRPLADYSVRGARGLVRVHFRDLEAHLCAYIRVSPLVVGAVAWLTSAAILEALAQCEAVSLVVQKEDFLRPDECTDRAAWAARLRQRYEKLHDFESRYRFPLLGQYSVCSDPSLEAVRCVGNHNRDREIAHPRMHHKFLVFCRWETPEEWATRWGEYLAASRERAERDGWLEQWQQDRAAGPQDDDWLPTVQPTAVWTGSFNLTQTAARSLENALYITDPDIVQAYFDEWQQIMGLSEPLDWESEWCAPEWRIGT